MDKKEKMHIFVLHGWAYELEKWKPFVHSLEVEGFSVTMLKIPGLTSDLEKIWTIEDYVEWLDDRKWAYIGMEGRTFGDVPLNIEMKMEVWDSPNSAGVVIDALRCCKLALDNGIGGPLIEHR